MIRTYIYSSAKAAMTGGDGRVQIGPLPTEAHMTYANGILQRFAEILNMTYEEWLASMRRDWFVDVLGYDPQLLLPPPA